MFQPPAPLPTPLRVARVIMWIQVAATGLLLAAQIVEVVSIEQDGEQLSGFGKFVIIEDPVLFVLALLAVIFVASRRHWARPLAVLVEVMAVMNGIVNVTGGFITGVVAIILAVVVISLLARPEVSSWLRRNAAVTEFGQQPRW